MRVYFDAPSRSVDESAYITNRVTTIRQAWIIYTKIHDFKSQGFFAVVEFHKLIKKKIAHRCVPDFAPREGQLHGMVKRRCTVT